MSLHLQYFNFIWIFYEPRELLAQVIIFSDLWDPVYGFSKSLGRNLHRSEVWFCIFSKRWMKGHISLGFGSIMSPIKAWIWVIKADPLNTPYILFISCLSPRDLIPSLMTLLNDREWLSAICLSLWNTSGALRWTMICIVGIVALSSNHLLISTGDRNPNLAKKRCSCEGPGLFLNCDSRWVVLFLLRDQEISKEFLPEGDRGFL